MHHEIPNYNATASKPARPAHGTCRLTLSINGTAYNVSIIPCDPSVASRAFRLKKTDGTAYDVAMTSHGPTCDCPDFVFHRDGLDPAGCKHCLALAAVNLLEPGKAR
jgi:hypothetical protein